MHRIPASLSVLLLGALAACTADVYDAELGYLGDRDGDGFVDAEEELAGSDADDAFNWDFGSGEWPDFTDEAERDLDGSNAGYGFGQTMPNFLATDQYGNQVPLHTFYGYAVVLDFVAGWCDPCRETAPQAQESWVEHRLDGVIVIHMMLDDNDFEQPGVRSGFQREWAGEYAIDFPVLYDEQDEVFSGLYANGVAGDYIPLAVVLDADMTITASFVGSDTFDDAVDLAVLLAD